MSDRILNSLLLCIAVLASAPKASADGGTYGSYTPYSIFGVGDIAQGGTAYNRSMGGVGIASRTARFVNILNPASVTARDSLSFMADFSLYGDNKLFSQKGASGTMYSASNTFNINDIAISFPIWKSSAMMLGVTPYSGTGYGYIQYATDPNIIGNTGDITYTNKGQGGIYQLFAAAGVTFFKKISLGAEFIYYFGDIEKSFSQSFTDDSFVGSTRTNSLQVNAPTGKFGIQFEQNIGGGVLCAGATYTLGTRMRGYMDTVVGNDTTSVVLKDLKGTDQIRFASELGAGLSYRHKDRFLAEFDYSRSDWSGTNIEKTSTLSGFTARTSNTFRAGVEYTPNRGDIRYYFKKVSYRAGAYYRNEYYQMNGSDITAMGITLGATLPISWRHNGVSLGLELGQRGSMADNLIRERYVNFSVGFNLYDIWFLKYHYD